MSCPSIGVSGFVSGTLSLYVHAVYYKLMVCTMTVYVVIDILVSLCHKWL